MAVLALTFSGIVLFALSTNAVPPSACLAKFRNEDCGKEPQPKMYYYKPGSRCEVGMWRGCLPSFNMFKDEYDCVSTCIFTVRVQPSDFHSQLAAESVESEEYGQPDETSEPDADNYDTDMDSTSNDTEATTISAEGEPGEDEESNTTTGEPGENSEITDLAEPGEATEPGEAAEPAEPTEPDAGA